MQRVHVVAVQRWLVLFEDCQTRDGRCEQSAAGWIRVRQDGTEFQQLGALQGRGHSELRYQERVREIVTGLLRHLPNQLPVCGVLVVQLRRRDVLAQDARRFTRVGARRDLWRYQCKADLRTSLHPSDLVFQAPLLVQHFISFPRLSCCNSSELLSFKVLLLELDKLVFAFNCVVSHLTGGDVGVVLSEGDYIEISSRSTVHGECDGTFASWCRRNTVTQFHQLVSNATTSWSAMSRGCRHFVPSARDHNEKIPRRKFTFS